MPSRARPARAWRMTERATPNSVERSRSAGRRSPGRRSPPAMRAARSVLTFLCSGSYMVRTICVRYLIDVVRTIFGRRGGVRDGARRPSCWTGWSSAPRARTSRRLRRSCARPGTARGRSGCAGTIETCDGRRASARVVDATTEPDGVLRKACGNRREAVCPPCAERYRQDAYHLIAAGLRGGKGVPDTVAEHPAVFVTLTAPSFGPVHTRALGADGQPRRCRPRRDAPVCPHGRAALVRRGARRGRSVPR